MATIPLKPVQDYNYVVANPNPIIKINEFTGQVKSVAYELRLLSREETIQLSKLNKQITDLHKEIDRRGGLSEDPVGLSLGSESANLGIQRQKILDSKPKGILEFTPKGGVKAEDIRKSPFQIGQIIIPGPNTKITIEPVPETKNKATLR